MITTLLIFIGFAVFYSLLANSYSSVVEGKKEGAVFNFACAGVYTVVITVLTGLIVGLRKNMPAGWEIGEFVIAIILIAGMAFLAWHFCVEGSAVIEMLVTLLLVLGTGMLARAAASYGSSIATGFMMRLIQWLPLAGIIIAFGFVLYEFFSYKYECTEKVVFQVLAVVVLLVALLTLIASAIIKLPAWGALKAVAEEAVSEEIESEPSEEIYEEIEVVEPIDTEASYHYAFYNPSLQYDEDEANDFNFGFNPYEMKEVKEAKTEDVPELLEKEFRDRIAIDPALLAADAAWADSIVGTRYIGVFYEAAKEDWAQAINDAKVAWMDDKMEYFATLDAFNAFLDSAYKYEILESDGKETDMMYMNPYTVDGIPDVIVMKTDDHSGHYLVYYFKIKGQEFKVAYRIECGYQPTNVSERMKIKPQPKPTPDPKPSNSGNNSNPYPDPKPTPQPTPTPSTYNKDKTQGTQGEVVKPNDNPGPGPNTNNGVGATESKVEEKPNSTEGTYQEYKESVQELKETNQQTKEAGESNTPSTPKPAPDTSQGQTSTKVDNAGAASANKPTAVSPLIHDAETGKVIQNDENNPSGVWEGPPD